MRYKTYLDFKRYAQDADKRHMDSICSSSSSDFKLQVQQNFLKDYITKNPNWRNMLLYHQIGAGKTCTAITIAEQFMKLNPKKQVTVILPARLRTNFFDELVSPCGMDAYISKAEFKQYYDSKTPSSTKSSIRTKFTKAISKKYEIISIEKFRQGALKFDNLKQWTKEFTKNKLIIIDEVHNLLSGTYDKVAMEKMDATGIPSRKKGFNTMLLKYMAKHADPSCKMLYLTATPIFDNLSQMRELVDVMEPGAIETLNNPRPKIRDLIEHLRNKVSFFPGTSPNAYPSTKYTEHNVVMSKTQDEYISQLQDEENDEAKEAFFIKQRQASISTPSSMNTIQGNLKEYAPKVLILLDEIKKHQGKHVVYSTFIEKGLNIVATALKKQGWTEYSGKSDNIPFKSYAIWDGSAKDARKQTIKEIANGKDNIDGKLIRVILGSPSIKEGVSFKHVQHLHLLDPVWNSSAKMQVEGRAVRFCSHIDIPKDHAFLKRAVNIHIYKLMPRKNGAVEITCDQKIYDTIIPDKQMAVESGEKALKKVAFDHYLFRKMYMDAKSPDKPIDSSKSDIGIDSADNKLIRKTTRKSIKLSNTCPKARRPDKYGNCNAPYTTVKLNNQQFECCYKSKDKKIKPASVKATSIKVVPKNASIKKLRL